MSRPILFASLFFTFLISICPANLLCQQSSATVASATPSTTTAGQAVTISATVSGQTNSTPIPTGSVSFYDGSTSLGNANLASSAIAAPKFTSFGQIFGSAFSPFFTYSVWSDVNGDGKPDLLGYAGKFQVFLNSGNGTYTTVAAQNFGSTNFVPMDFDGDGKKDIVFLTNTGAVQVAYGNGDGTFRNPVSAPGISGSANLLAAADLLGSGLPYILLGQNAVPPASASITVYKNNGQGSFSSIGSFPVTASSTSNQTIRQILSQDLNGDGKLDLAVALQSGDTITGNTSVPILLNQGDGTFAAPATILAGSNCSNSQCASAVVAGDFAARGKTDLAVLDNTGVEIYPGNSDGTFAAAVHLKILGSAGYTGSSLQQLIVEDINGDGKLDIVECGGYAYLGNGDFTFTPTGNLLNLGINQITNSTSGGTGLTVLLGDIDGDGVVDLLFGYEGFMNHFDSLVQFGSRNSVASLPAISTFTGGIHPILAKYNGDSNFASSTSASVNVTVNKTATKITGNATPNPALTTQSINLTVQVTSNGPTATGNVTFTEGSAALGVATLDSHGAGSVNVTLSTAASHNITLSYAGDAFNLPSTLSETVVTVANFPSTTMLSTSINPATITQPVTFTASVAQANQGVGLMPTGNVVFLNGTTQLGTVALDSTGKATFTTSFTTIGNQTITANYIGDAANQPSSSSLVEAVLSAFDFQPANSGSSTIVVNRGSSASLPIAVSSQNGFAGTVSFNCTGLPTNVSCTFAPNNVTLSSTTPTTVTLNIAAGTNVSFNRVLPQQIFTATAIFGCLFFVFPARQNRKRWYLLSLFFTIAVLGISGCSGSSSSSNNSSTYNFNVTASSGAAQKTATYTLIVK